MHKHGGGGGQLTAEGFTQASALPFPASASRVNFLPNTKREVPEGKGGRHEEEEEGREGDRVLPAYDKSLGNSSAGFLEVKSQYKQIKSNYIPVHERCWAALKPSFFSL